MRHHELADSLIQARTRRNIAGRAERKHLQGSKLEGGNGRLQPHAPARCLPRRRPPIPIRFHPSCGARAPLSTICISRCTVAGSGPAGAPGAPPADNRPRLVDVRRLPSTLPPSGYELAVTVATSRQCLSSLAHEPRQRPSPRHARHAHAGSVLIRRPAARSVRDGPTRSSRLRLRPSPADFGRPDLA